MNKAMAETAGYPNIHSFLLPLTDRIPPRFLLARYRAALETTFPSLPYTTDGHVTNCRPMGGKQLSGHAL